MERRNVGARESQIDSHRKRHEAASGTENNKSIRWQEGVKGGGKV